MHLTQYEVPRWLRRLGPTFTLAWQYSSLSPGIELHLTHATVVIDGDGWPLRPYTLLALIHRSLAETGVQLPPFESSPFVELQGLPPSRTKRIAVARRTLVAASDNKRSFAWTASHH